MKRKLNVFFQRKIICGTKFSYNITTLTIKNQEKWERIQETDFWRF